MSDDFKTSFFDFLKERTTTPLAINLLVSFAYFNWHSLIWLFYSNSGNPQELIFMLSQHNTLYFKPIICGTIITLGFPLINIIVLRVIEWTKLERNKIKMHFSTEKWYPNSYVQNLLNKIIHLEEKVSRLGNAEQELNGLNEEVSTTKSKLSKTTTELENLKDEHTGLTKAYEEQKVFKQKLDSDFKEISRNVSIPNWMLDRDFKLVPFSNEALNIAFKNKTAFRELLKEPLEVISFNQNYVQLDGQNHLIISTRVYEREIVILFKIGKSFLVINVNFDEFNKIPYFNISCTDEIIENITYKKYIGNFISWSEKL